MDELETLEQRVGEKWAAAAATRAPQWDLDDDPLDLSNWSTGDPDTAPVMQFPRERWASYPAKRTATLLMCEKLLDHADELTDQVWVLLCAAMFYGGRTRIA